MRHTFLGQTATAYLEGELDHHSAPAVRKALDELLDTGALKTLVLDMSGLTFMDSSGIGVILGRYNRMTERGGSVAVAKPSPGIHKLLSMTGIYQLVKRLD